MLSVIVCAQNNVSFTIQKDGTFKSDKEQSYIVVEYPQKTKEELYGLFYTAVNKTFTNSTDLVFTEGAKLLGKIPKDEVKTIEYNRISVVFSTDDLFTSRVIFAFDTAFQLILNIEFKDEKAKIEVQGLKFYLYIHPNMFAENDWESFASPDGVLNALFTKEEFIPTGKEKKDAKRKAKCDKYNAENQEKIQKINDAVNIKINKLLSNVDTNDEEW